MVMSVFSKDDIFKMLSVIPDPEIPVVSIQEMGMLRDVVISDKGYEVILTPTYTGCHAMGMIEAEIKSTLDRNKVFPATVRMVYEPAWTTDWMNDEAKEKLRRYGIAPPISSTCNSSEFVNNSITCPHCGGVDTTMVSRFGATACKALYKCNSCKEPFEYFKCH